MDFLNHKLLFFGGKGGVGKTSLACATALRLSSKGKKVLLLSTDPAHSLSDSLGKDFGDTIEEYKKNLYVLQLNAQNLLSDYKKKYGNSIKQIASEGTFFSNEEIQQFFDLSLPGLDEFMALIEVMDLLESDSYDHIILDTAPTGHTLRLLEMPNLMQSYINVLISMRKKHHAIASMLTRRYVKDAADEYIERMLLKVSNVKSILTDTTKTSFLVVSIPESLSVMETERLVSILKVYKIPIGGIFINRILKEHCNFCKSRLISQEKHLQKLTELGKGLNIYKVPLFSFELQKDKLSILSSMLFDKDHSIPEDNTSKVSSSFSCDPLSISSSTKYIFIGGKGGVGKTTCAASIGLSESKLRKTLLLSTDPAHSLQDSLGVPIGSKVKKVKDNLYAVELDARSELQKFKQEYKTEIATFFSSVFKTTTVGTIDAPYDRKVIEQLIDLSPPGIDEIMALKQMIDLTKDNSYDLYIFDTAPSGHTIRLLEMPELAQKWGNTLLEILDKYPLSMELGDTLQSLLEAIKKVREILIDKTQTTFGVITIAESMSVLESKKLLSSLNSLHVPVSFLLANKIIPESTCNFCSTIRAHQIESLKELKDFGLPLVCLEMFDSEVQGIDLLGKVSDNLYHKS
jgi:arsenite/tail-anchored protein-transporting ATPase